MSILPRKRITPQWVGPLAFAGDNTPTQQSSTAMSYVETQESHYLEEYHHLCQLESAILDLAAFAHHYACRDIPEANEHLFAEDMAYNFSKKRRILTLLERLTPLQESLKEDVIEDDEEEEEDDDTEESEDDDVVVIIKEERVIVE